jgi:hypothetical protein
MLSGPLTPVIFAFETGKNGESAIFSKYGRP